jgi:biotin/methionine sulfoxide reductase
LPTPSGKIEIFCEEIAGFGYDDCPGHPVWMEPAEWLGSPTAERLPLHLISNQPAHKLHSQLDFVGPSKVHKIQGREVALLSPDEAARRRIEDGAFIKVYNDRGHTIAVARISENVMDGVVMLPTGAWFDPTSAAGEGGLEKHGNPNVLTLDKGTSKLGQGPIAHTTLVEVEVFEGELPPVSAFEIPEIVPLADAN